jgi:iron complex outermembrane recepter protein
VRRRDRTTMRLLAAAFAFAPAAGTAQSPPPDAATTITLPTIEVIGTSPLPAVGIDRDKLPANVQSVLPPDSTRQAAPTLTNQLDERLGSISLNANLNNPFQPDVQFRGFTASPVVGTPSGIAVYQNGVRLNDPFGDFVSWDLVPDFAVNRLDVIPTNPVYGLNAIGGAIVLNMKNGFNFQGFEATASGGSFARRQFTAEYGKQIGNIGAYVGVNAIYDGGFRRRSQSQVRQLYADVGGESERGSVHVSFSGANNNLQGIGPTPIQLVDIDRRAVFVSPQTFRDTLATTSVNGNFKATDALSFQTNFYYRSASRQSSAGNITEAQPCDAAIPNTLCFGDSTTVLVDTSGRPVMNILGGLPPGQDDNATVNSVGLGGSAQATYTAPLFGHDNHLVVGASLDHGNVDYTSVNIVSVIDPISLVTTPLGPIISQPDGALVPIRLQTTNSYYGLYFSDTFDVTPAFAITAGGRYNLAMIRLIDKLGSALNGNNRFARFNPAIGATYKFRPGLTGYFGYAEANRAPTAGEIGCSDPTRPCSLDLFVSADPPGLRQVVARTYETGLRGRMTLGAAEGDGRIDWNLGLFRTDLQDDIIAVPSEIISTGFFQNIPGTRRQGVEAGIAYRDGKWRLAANYTLIDATFESRVELASPTNPKASQDGEIKVNPGDRIPGIPRHRVKLNVDYAIDDRWSIGGTLLAASNQFFFGDEANLTAPLGGYAVVNLRSSYKLTDSFEIFALVQNLFDSKYATYGIYGDPARTPLPGVPNPSDPRFISVAPPLAVYGGVRVKL